MFINSVKMKIDRNTSDFWQIVCKNVDNFNITAFVGFIVRIVY